MQWTVGNSLRQSLQKCGLTESLHKGLKMSWDPSGTWRFDSGTTLNPYRFTGNMPQSLLMRRLKLGQYKQIISPFFCQFVMSCCPLPAFYSLPVPDFLPHICYLCFDLPALTPEFVFLLLSDYTFEHTLLPCTDFKTRLWLLPHIKISAIELYKQEHTFTSWSLRLESSSHDWILSCSAH